MYYRAMSIFVIFVILVIINLRVAYAENQIVNVYTYREPKLIIPLFERFTSQTGILVNVIYAKDGLEQRIKAEGKNSPADLLISVDVARLIEAVQLGIVQPYQSETLENVSRPIYVIQTVIGTPCRHVRASSILIVV